MDKGIYCLVFKNPECTLRAGALGDIAFRAGWHVYVGSALGPGGLSRMGRHVHLAARSNRPPKWHIDYLTTSPEFSLRYTVYAVTERPLECHLAGSLGLPYVKAFGCSDCRCLSHLFFRKTDPRSEIIIAFENTGLDPLIKTLIRYGEKGKI